MRSSHERKLPSSNRELRTDAHNESLLDCIGFFGGQNMLGKALCGREIVAYPDDQKHIKQTELGSAK